MHTVCCSLCKGTIKSLFSNVRSQHSLPLKDKTSLPPSRFNDVTQRYPPPNKRCVMTLLIVGKFKLTPEGDQCGQLLPNYIEKLLTMI